MTLKKQKINTKNWHRPIFPKFKIVELSDKNDIDEITNAFQPYCDFNFSNIHNWSDPNNPTTYSIHNRNLIIKMVDFTTDRKIVSFLGKNKSLETALLLLKNNEELTMVPESSVSDKMRYESELIIEEDISNHDYILSLPDMVRLEGRKFKYKRRSINDFLRLYPNHKVSTIDISGKKAPDDLFDFLKRWKHLKRVSDEDTQREYIALERLIKNSKYYKMLNVGIYEGKNLIAFTINEIKGEYAMGGFGKSDYTFNGLSDYMEYATAKILLMANCQFLNYEQDLGIPGLREHKSSWHPITMLKKYKIKRKI
jgi:hypothetical protein